MNISHTRVLFTVALLLALTGCEKYVETAESGGVTQDVQSIVPRFGAEQTTTEPSSVSAGVELVASAQTTRSAAAEPTQPSPTSLTIQGETLATHLDKIKAWVDGWFINTQIHAYYECTNLMVGIVADKALALATEKAFDADPKYATLAAFVRWSMASDMLLRSNALAAMRATVTSKTWPFYMFAMLHSPQHIARASVIPPSEVLARVFPPESLWDAGLVGLGLFYRECDGEEALITYWSEIRKRRPVLAGAAVIHQIAAARRMNDADRVIKMLRENIEEVRQAPWTVERAMWTLNGLSHPDVLTISNMLVAPR